MKNIKKQHGEVSLFVVIFSALLITIVTVSFIRLMIQSQQQATATDLSQSAYDSAQVGVEDAKRALIRYQSICNSGGDCDQTKLDINSATCNEAVGKLTDVSANESNNEVKVQTGGANALDQAYTCVKISTSTDDYLGTLAQDTSKFIPLLGVSDFDRIKVEWFTVKDLQNPASTTFSIPALTASTPPLLSQSIWATSPGQNRPSIMRTQLIQFSNSGFKLSDFDSNGPSGSNSTLFLYPMNFADMTRKFSDNARLTPPNEPVRASCSSNVANVYACSATIQLPVAVSSSDHSQYLNLTSLYKQSSFRVTLLNSTGGNVKFDGVQPSIDSTGRANDLFRRVQTRVELTNVNIPYPQAAINITGNFCKDFSITDQALDYLNNCIP